jgi:hypothetical protein
MGEKMMVTHVVQKNGEFFFREQDISENPLHFIATAIDDDGRETILVPGREYRTWINGFVPDMLFVEEMGGAKHGQYLGICRPVTTAVYGDKTARHAAVRAHEQRLEKAMAPYYKQGQKLLQEHSDRVEHNAEIFEGKKLTDTERRVQEGRLASPDDGDLSDLTTPVEVTPAPSEPEPSTDGSLSDLI